MFFRYQQVQLWSFDVLNEWEKIILENDGLGGEGAPAALGLETRRNDNVIDFPISDLDQELVGSKSWPIELDQYGGFADLLQRRVGNLPLC